MTVHLNTDNLHCHFVVNPISFKDGSRFQNKIYNHRRLREISDDVCREYGKNVLEHSDFYGGKSRGAYWAEKKGHPTHRDMLKADVEYCLKTSDTWERFEKQLYGLGYTIDWTRMSVRAKGWERAVRLRGIGYTDEIIERRLADNRRDEGFIMSVWNCHLPKKNKSVLLTAIANELGYSIEHTRDVVEIYVDLMFLILVTALQAIKTTKDAIIMSVELRHAVKDLQEFIGDYHFLRDVGIRTIPELDRYIESTQTKITELERERNLLRNKVRRESDPAVLAENKAARSEITNNHIEPLRKNLKRARKIREKSPHLYELLRQELQMEAPYAAIRGGKVIFKNAPERGAR